MRVPSAWGSGDAEEQLEAEISVLKWTGLWGGCGRRERETEGSSLDSFRDWWWLGFTHGGRRGRGTT